ncbi:MAG: hypothetical protein IPK82_24285 [Polyangiaceae bacterium]|nr:hypothetical protein [Polyangiaceae bacterium]
MENSFLRKRYTLVRGAVKRAVRERWGSLPIQEVAKRFQLSTPTTRKVLQSRGIYNEQTLLRLEETLTTDRVVLATAVDENTQPITPDLASLGDLPSPVLQKLFRVGGTIFTAGKRASRLVHWAYSVQDDERSHRALVTMKDVPESGGYGLVEVKPQQNACLNMVISMILPIPAGFALAIDFGQLTLTADKAESHDIIGRETFQKAAAPHLTVVTYTIRDMCTQFLLRSDQPFEARFRECLGVNEAEKGLQDPSNPLVGFRARGLFHLD